MSSEKLAQRNVIMRCLISVKNWITGKETDPAKRIAKIDETSTQIIDILNHSRNISVYLLRESTFGLILSAQTEGEKSVFKPITLRALNGDVEVGIDLSLRITDPLQFVAHFMPGRRSLRRDELIPEVEKVLMPVFRARFKRSTIDEYGIPEELLQTLTADIDLYNEYFEGFEICRLVDVRCESDSFRRFAELCKKMYQSERELEYLIRTNDFKNRLAAAENEQKIKEAKTDYDLQVVLDDINRDKILHDEEMKAFYRLISRQRRIAEAKDEAEIEKALNEIAETKLIDQDRLDAIRTDLATKKIKREDIAEVIRLESEKQINLKKNEIEIELDKSTHELNKTKLYNKIELTDIERGAQRANDIADAKHHAEMTNIAIEEQKTKDAYTDSRWEIEFNRGNLIHNTQISRRVDEGMIGATIEDRIEALRLERLKQKQELSYNSLARLEELDNAKKNADAAREKDKADADAAREKNKADADAAREKDKADADAAREERKKDNDHRRAQEDKQNERDFILKLKEQETQRELQQESQKEQNRHEEAMARHEEAMANIEKDKQNERDFILKQREQESQKEQNRHEEAMARHEEAMANIEKEKYSNKREHELMNEYLEKKAAADAALRAKEQEWRDKQEADRKAEEERKAQELKSEKESMAQERKLEKENIAQERRELFQFLSGVLGNKNEEYQRNMDRKDEEYQRNMDRKDEEYQRNMDRYADLAKHKAREAYENEARLTKDMERQKEEYREDKCNAQSRLDDTLKHSLSTISQVAIGQPAPRPWQRQEQSDKTTCPNCGKPIKIGFSCCPYCQQKIK